MSLRRKLYRWAAGGLMRLCAGLCAALAALLCGYVLWRGAPLLSAKLLCTAPSYRTGQIGILPDLLGTLYLILASLPLTLLLGVGAAVYLTEYARGRRLTALIEYAAETLAGIPSILYGLVGMLFFGNFLGLRTSLLAGGLTLAVMNLPVVLRTTQESLKTVPDSYREGAFGLGAGRWRVIRTVVLPGCVDGILTGCILAVGRMLGESAALLFTAGFAHELHGLWAGLHSSGCTLAVALYAYAKEQGEFGIAFAIAVLLMALALLVQIAAGLAGRLAARAKGGDADGQH